MSPIEYATRNIYFEKDSPITGRFKLSLYPFMGDPLNAIADIQKQCLVVFGPTQSVKTVWLEIAIAYLLDAKRASLLAVAQTDDDALEFAKIKLIPFLEKIATLTDTTKKDRNARTIKSWLWPTHELIISGPGENAQQSKSVRYLVTDESHQYCKQYPGAMTSLRNRMGGRWNRMEIHATTAPDAGTEVDLLYAAGRQNEWHLGCPHCHKLFWPLWQRASRKHYNGHEIFRWKESQSENETLDSITMYCPHCDKEIPDIRSNREAMSNQGKYIAMNENADKTSDSFRWNAFAVQWKSYRDFLKIYLEAIKHAKLGNFEPYKDWVTKQEARSWEGEYPLDGDSEKGKTYSLSDIKVVEPDECRFLSIDQQEGKKGEGFHLWAQVCQYRKDGSSKRVDYQRISTYEDAKAFQLRHNVENRNVCIDYGEGIREREIFGVCARYYWRAFKSTDEDEFSHVFTKAGQVSYSVKLPYSSDILESATVGQKAHGALQIRNGTTAKTPPGFCIANLWSKPKIYPIFYALKNGETDRQYGIAKDLNPEYEAQVHSYIPSLQIDPKSQVTKKVVWKKIKADDHAWITSCQNLIMAIMRGYYPMAKLEEKQIAPR